MSENYTVLIKRSSITPSLTVFCLRRGISFVEPDAFQLKNSDQGLGCLHVILGTQGP